MSRETGPAGDGPMPKESAKSDGQKTLGLEIKEGATQRREGVGKRLLGVLVRNKGESRKREACRGETYNIRGQE